eukprot:CAMPEP_0118896304 /NCGR_PEP_ID=MMETSP1166-20130328/4240_1 /TAXON_ID=1104430 /ORGANISM="Chrysoreinhardia sp, Strain CCMP3193" /LENGTH=229 /DNA_ID=CAMNT_0006835361 /DNA_START=97 /DNA_END=786 /DNA_ORIENTATION=+
MKAMDIRISVPELSSTSSVVLQGAEVLLSMTTFSVMAASTSSRHGVYHYQFYASLTLVVVVGVCGWLFGLFLFAARFLRVVSSEALERLEVVGAGLLAYLSYTAAVAASATSTDLHTTFDATDGPVCHPYAHRSRFFAASHFCSRVVAATVLAYLLSATYAASFVVAFKGTSYAGYSRTPTTAGGYDDIDVAMTPLTSSASSSRGGPPAGDSTSKKNNIGNNNNNESNV